MVEVRSPDPGHPRLGVMPRRRSVRGEKAMTLTDECPDERVQVIVEDRGDFGVIRLSSNRLEQQRRTFGIDVRRLGCHRTIVPGGERNCTGVTTGRRFVGPWGEMGPRAS